MAFDPDLQPFLDQLAALQAQVDGLPDYQADIAALQLGVAANTATIAALTEQVEAYHTGEPEPPPPPVPANDYRPCGLSPSLLSGSLNTAASWDARVNGELGPFNAINAEKAAVWWVGSRTPGWMCWEGWQFMRALCTMYRVTGDIKYIEAALDIADWQISQRHDKLGSVGFTYFRAPAPYEGTSNPGPFWTLNNSGGYDTSVLALNTGRICWALMTVVDQVKESGLTQFDARADTIAAECKVSLDAYETMMATFGPSFYSLNYSDGAGDLNGNLIVNQQCNFYAPILILNKWYPDAMTQKWVDRAQLMVDAFKADAVYPGDGTIIWSAWFVSSHSYQLPDTNHAAYTADFLHLAYRLGYLGIDNTLMTQVAKTIAQNVWNPSANTNNKYIDGTGGAGTTAHFIAASYINYMHWQPVIGEYAAAFLNANMINRNAEFHGNANLLEAVQPCG